MFKINMILYFYIATGLVAGEWRPQEYGQNQLRYSLPPPSPPQFDQRQFLPIVIPEQSPRLPQARPCQRRNYGELGAVLTNSGWVPLPVNQPSPSITATDQQTRSQLVQPQLKPQSLIENRVPAVDAQNQESKQSPKSTFPDKIVEYVEKSSLPNQMSQTRSIDGNENNRPILDQVVNVNPFETATVDEDAATHKVRSGYPDQSSQELVNSREISHECGKHGDSHQDLRYDDSETQDLVKSAPTEAQEQAVQILPDCVQGSRRAMQDVEGDSRRFETSSISSLSEVDKTEAKILPKVQSNDDSKTSSMKSARLANKNNIKPYLLNPATNAGKWQSDRHVSLMENGKVCYACSTYYDPSCWTTNATTTVKYCNRDNNACVSKMYKIEGKMILIRDCGHTCNNGDVYHVGQKMTSCSMCHEDLCNGACALQRVTGLLVALIISALKYTS